MDPWLSLIRPLTISSSSSLAVEKIVGIFKFFRLLVKKVKPLPSGKVTSKIIKFSLGLSFNYLIDEIFIKTDK